MPRSFSRPLTLQNPRLVAALLGTALLALAGCSESPVLPTAPAAGERPTQLEPAPLGSSALAPGGETVVYRFNDLEICDSLDPTFPSPYQGLNLSGSRALAVCNGRLVFAASDPAPQTAVFHLAGAASRVSIRVNGYGEGGARSLVAFGSDGAEVARDELAGGRHPTPVVLEVEGVIHSVSITDSQNNGDWDDLTVDYLPAAPRDATPPSIGFALFPGAPDGAGGWYRGEVRLSWSVEEAESPGSLAVSGCDEVVVSGDQGPTTYSCAASSDGGSAAPVSVTIQRDGTAPELTFGGNAGSYTIDQAVAITCEASDATSGVAAGCEGLSAPAYTLEPGTNVVSGEALDVAGNRGAATAELTVSATYSSLCAVTQEVVSNESAARTLCVGLRVLEQVAARGNDRVEALLLRAFRTQVERASGKWLDADDAALIGRWAATL